MRPLGDILTDIVNGVTISDEDKDGLRLLGNQLQNVSSSVSGWTQGDPGQISNVSFLAGGSNVLIDALGIRIYDPPLLTGWWEIDGDLRIGSSITSPDTTSFAIFSNSQTYNGESMGAGDVLFGSNSSGYANLLWDLSAKTFYFRGGTTPQVSISTTGALTAGGGNVKIDSDGIIIIPNSVWSAKNAYKFLHVDGSDPNQFGMYGIEASTSMSLRLSNAGILNDGWSREVNLLASSNAATCQVNIGADDLSGTNSYFRVTPTGLLSYTEGGFYNYAYTADDSACIFMMSKNTTSNEYFQVVVDPTEIKLFCSSTGATIKLESTGLIMGSAAHINEFSTDTTMAGNSDTALPTEKAVKAYADTKLSDAPSDSTTYGRNNAAWAVVAGGGGDKYPCEARLTLETGVPVSTTDQTAKTIVYLTLYNGDQVALYDGSSAWTTYTLTEKHVDLTEAQSGTTTNGNKIISGLTDTSQLIPGMAISGTNVGAGSVIDTVDSATQITGTVNSTGSATNTITFKVPASTVCDIFAYASSSAVKLELCKWTSGTVRATALTTQNGIYVKTGATTRRYVGTISTTTTAGQTEDSITTKYVWNYYNGVSRALYKTDNTGHAYTGATKRPWNNVSTNCVNFVLGIASNVNSSITGAILATAGHEVAVSHALDNTGGTVENQYGYISTYDNNWWFGGCSGYKVIDAGSHYILCSQWSEASYGGTYSFFCLRTMSEF